MSILTIINDGDKEFDEKFTSNRNAGIGAPESADFRARITKRAETEFKSFLHSRELALVEGLKARYEGMKMNSPKTYTKGSGFCFIHMQEFNAALSLAIAELDEAITHLKEKK